MMDAEQTIFRAVKQRGYVTIRNAVFRDARLSWGARGVLGYLLTRPDNWEIRIPDLLHHGPSGRDAMRKMLKELTECGYLVRTKEKREDGTFRWISYVYETPITPSPENTSMAPDESPLGSGAAAPPESDNPATVEPSPAEPATDAPPTEQPPTDPPTTANTAIYEEEIQPKTESPKTESPTPERAPRAAADDADDSSCTEFFLLSQGVSRKKAHQFRTFDPRAVEAAWAEAIGQATGQERDYRIGRLLDRWEVAPPAAPAAAQSLRDAYRQRYGDLFVFGSDDAGDTASLDDVEADHAA